MFKRINLISLTIAFVLTFSLSVMGRTIDATSSALNSTVTLVDTDRDRDGLLGPVRRIKTETARLVNKGGVPAEGQRQVLETAAYDLKGSKIENAYFPISGANALTGKETYKYDEKGNISEMTLLNADGSLLGKEVYTYEYDFVGNWTKMTTSVAVIEGGKVSYEPTEVTHRTISYYLDEALAKLVQPASATVTPAAAAPTTNPTSNPPSNAANKPAANNATLPAQAKSDKTASAVPQKVDPNLLGKAAVSGPSVSLSTPGSESNTDNKPIVASDVAPPFKAGPKPLLRPISGGVLNGKAIELPAPQYPEVAKRARATGLVVVEVVIDANGKVISAKAISGNGMLQAAAVQAALRARFSPTTLSGLPVKVSGVINYNFALGR